jgi:septum formation protein
MTHPFLPPLRRDLVLASRSPRRAELLERHRLSFDILPAEIEEARLPDESIGDYVERLGREKALVAAKLRPLSACIGADTIVVLGDRVLEKPANSDDAAAMLRALSGRSHLVLSSVALACAELDFCNSRVQRSEVRFRELRDDEIERYVATGEAMDKAGSYGIQDYGALMVASIQGDYFAVMGLPLQMLRELWIEFAAEDRGGS